MSYRPRPAGTLKQATDVLTDAVGGGTRAADLTGLSKHMFYRYSSDSEENANCTMPAGIIRQLETVARDPVLTRFLAAEQGYILLKVPDHPGGGLLAERAASIASQVGRLFENIARALSPVGDGGSDVTAREAGGLIAELDALILLGSALRGELVAIRDGEAC